MSSDTRLILIALAAATVLLILVSGALHFATVEEIRIGDGHVASSIGQHDDHMQAR